MRDLRAALRRADVQLGMSVGASIAMLLAVLMGVLFFVATHEAAEVMAGTLQTDLRHVAFETERTTSGFPSDEPITKGTVIRRYDAQGVTHDLVGRWPAAARLFPHRTPALRLAFAAPEDFLVRTLSLPNGERLQGAASLAEFVEDRQEQIMQLGASFAFGLLGVIAVAIFATRQAFEPLRSATREVDAVTERRLDSRIGVRGSGDDIDRHAIALNRVFQRLEDSFLRLAAFSSDVAHELRTPVNRMLNLADVALLSGEGTVSPEIVAIREAAEGMRRLIERLLLLARGDAGRLPLRRVAVDLGELANNLADLFRPSCEQSGVSLRVHVRGEQSTAEIDAGLVQQAVSNLLDNAIRHSPQGSEIRLDIATDVTSATLAVSDAGPGVAPEDRGRIFDRFVQLDESRTGSGTGLGLAIVRMIARLHAGDVVVGASILGGARFAIRLQRPQGVAATRRSECAPDGDAELNEEPVIFPSLS
jgi:signal transduction histidine kinase